MSDKNIDRGFKVLEAVIDEYIRTGEPIGSKSICEKLEFPVSAATVRNEMATLEQKGYLESPHTSAGRVPTVKGYRLYIERLVPESRTRLSDEDRLIIDNALDEIRGATDEVIIESASHALAELTKCAVVSTSNVNRFSVITKVEVIPTGKRMYVLLLITSGGDIKNRVCRLSFDLTNEQLDFFTNFVNENLAGLNLESVSPDYIEKIGAALGSYMLSMSPLLKAVADLSKEMTAKNVKFEGESNLIALSDFSKGDVLSILESKNLFKEILDNAFSGINVMFGDENTFTVSNSGLIAGSFQKNGMPAGSFGVIGPMRLDYKKLLPYIEYFAVKVTGLLNENEKKQEDEQ